MKISIIGTGYVGLVTGACLAEMGHRVVCVDTDEKKIDQISKGAAPFYEKDLDALLKKNLDEKLRATLDLREAVLGTDLTLMAVGTPFDGKEIDLGYIKKASEQIGEVLKEKSGFHLVTVKSTVVPGTTDDVVTRILEASSKKRAGIDFGVGVNPEFLTEGQAVSDFMNPDRIVIGANDRRCMDLLDELYASFPRVPKVRCNNKTAEMIKYASNAMLATQISFANELANFCSTLGGVDIVDVMKGVHLSNYLQPVCENGKRIKAPLSSFLEAGCGFGGSCLPKDLKALIARGKSIGARMNLLSAVMETNERQPIEMLKLIKKHYPKLEKVRIAVLGLSFKPDTDDMRESPAIPIIRGVISEGAIVKAYDPVANDAARKVFSTLPISICETLSEAISGVDIVALVTRWEEFRGVPDLLKSQNPGAVFIDGRRMLDKVLFEKYEGIGV